MSACFQVGKYTIHLGPSECRSFFTILCTFHNVWRDFGVRLQETTWLFTKILASSIPSRLYQPRGWLYQSIWFQYRFHWLVSQIRPCIQTHRVFSEFLSWVLNSMLSGGACNIHWVSSICIEYMLTPRNETTQYHRNPRHGKLSALPSTSTHHPLAAQWLVRYCWMCLQHQRT